MARNQLCWTFYSGSIMVTDLCEQEPVEHEVRLELSSPVLSLISNVRYTLCVII